MKSLLLRGMLGLGDNIYQRSIVRELAKHRTVYLETAWPQLYCDIPIYCVPRSTPLRTQARNIARPDVAWSTRPTLTNRAKLCYVGEPHKTIVQALLESAGLASVEAITFDLPTFAPMDMARPYIVIRPASIRREWRADSRNPLPEYLAMAAQRLREQFHIVSIADFADGEEWPVDPLPYADVRFHAGELQVEQLMALVAGAAGVVGGVGWLVPAALAYRVPMLLIFGGWGFHNGPQRIFDGRIDSTGITRVIPDRFCQCRSPIHECDKRISGIADAVERWAVGFDSCRPVRMVA